MIDSVEAVVVFQERVKLFTKDICTAVSAIQIAAIGSGDSAYTAEKETLYYLEPKYDPHHDVQLCCSAEAIFKLFFDLVEVNFGVWVSAFVDDCELVETIDVGSDLISDTRKSDVEDRHHYDESQVYAASVHGSCFRCGGSTD